MDLGDGRTLRVSGRIDRIDRRPDGTLVLRDYKTGKAPRDDGGLFRGGRQLQIPFYVLAAARIFPDEPVVPLALALMATLEDDRATAERYRAELDQLAELLLHQRPASITDINIQAGEDPVAVREIALPLIRLLRRETSLGVSVCLGTLRREDYDALKASGAEAIFPPGTVIAEAADALLAALNRQLGHEREAAE